MKLITSQWLKWSTHNEDKEERTEGKAFFYSKVWICRKKNFVVLMKSRFNYEALGWNIIVCPDQIRQNPSSCYELIINSVWHCSLKGFVWSFHLGFFSRVNVFLITEPFLAMKGLVKVAWFNSTAIESPKGTARVWMVGDRGGEILLHHLCLCLLHHHSRHQFPGMDSLVCDFPSDSTKSLPPCRNTIWNNDENIFYSMKNN